MIDRVHTDLQREDFQHALKQFDSYIDVTPDDLMQITQLAQGYAHRRQAEQLLVRDIMTTDVATVTPATSLRDAARILLELRISGLPVTDTGNRLVGIVTEADFLTAIGIPYHHPAHSLWQTLESMFTHQSRRWNAPESVGDIMATQVITVTEDQTLHDVIDAMKSHHIKRVVVIDEQRQVRGIVTCSNLVRVLLRRIL